jgi:hypothetical protein
LGLKKLLGVVGETKVLKVADIDADIIYRSEIFPGGTVEHAWAVWTHGEAHAVEDPFNQLVPVVRARSEAVEGFLEEPKGTKFTHWTAFGRADDDCFVCRKVGLTEGVLAMALLFLPCRLDGHRLHDARAFVSEDRGKFVALGPYPVFMVS